VEGLAVVVGEEGEVEVELVQVQVEPASVVVAAGSQLVVPLATRQEGLRYTEQ